MKITKNNTCILTVRYKKYIIEVILDTDNTYEVWIYKKDMGVKMFCWGVKSFDISMLNDYTINEYIELYDEFIREEA